MSDPIKQPKVAKVLTQYKVLLNVGIRDGFELGDDFLIYRVGEEVLDPDTGESLGAYEEVIGRGTITHIQDAMCTLESSDVKNSGRKVIKKYKPASQLAPFSQLAGLFSDSTTEEIIEEGENITRPFSYAQVGDYAKLLSN